MSTEPFTREEETDILRFLGYPDWTSEAQSIQLGYPAASQPLFLVRDSLGRVSPTARAPIRQYLAELRCIEREMSQSRSRFRADRLGEISLNRTEPGQLREEYRFWQRRLADDLGVVPNPYAQLQYVGMPGGANAKVMPS